MMFNAHIISRRWDSTLNLGKAGYVYTLGKEESLFSCPDSVGGGIAVQS